MSAIPNCFRRHAVYYWRRWLPGVPRELVQLSLGVKEARTARILSSTLTALSDGLFALRANGQMDKEQLLEYLRRALADARALQSTDGLSLLAHGLAARMIAVKGLSAELSSTDRIDLERGWGQPELADLVTRSLQDIRHHAPNLQDFVEASIAASVGAGLEPTGEDAEAAARVRWLAEASKAFEAAQDHSVADIRVDKLIGDIASGKGLPAASRHREPLPDWLDRTIAFLEGYNPHEWEGREAEFEFATLLDDVQPTLLADWIRLSRPDSFVGDQDHLDKLTETLKAIRSGLNKTTSALKTAPQAAVAEEPAAHTGMSISVKTVPNGSTIEVLAERFVRRQLDRERWDVKTAKQARATFALFSRLMLEERGVALISALSQPDLEHFHDFLLDIHKSYGKSVRDKDRSIAELRAIAAMKPASERGLDIGTRTRHFGFLSSLFAMANETESLDSRLRPQSFTGKKKVRARDQRSVPKAAMVETFFEAPVFTGCADEVLLDAPGSHVFHRAAYFGPMLAHYQGMRREEFCGLAVDEIIVDNGPHPYIHVNFNAFRRLKNNQSIRNLALHPELVRLGFLDYVEHLRKLGHNRLFPDLYNPAAHAPLGDRLYRELMPIRERLGVTPHQFRHFFNDELKQKRVSHEFREDMMGHRGRSETTERYCDAVHIELQLEDLAKLELRTAHLIPRPIRLLQWVEKCLPPPWSRSHQKLSPYS